jgi:pimeloyl-ACP methyl ester carboxylesterase
MSLDIGDAVMRRFMMHPVFRSQRVGEVMSGFVEALGLRRYALYVFDYGAPVGFRLALRHPERVRANISLQAIG